MPTVVAAHNPAQLCSQQSAQWNPVCAAVDRTNGAAFVKTFSAAVQRAFWSAFHETLVAA